MFMCHLIYLRCHDDLVWNQWTQIYGRVKPSKMQNSLQAKFIFFFNFIKNISVQTADHHGEASLQLQMTSFGSDISHDGLKQKRFNFGNRHSRMVRTTSLVSKQGETE